MQELAYASDGSSHTNGKKEYYGDASGIETDGYYGDKVYSRMDWLEFKDWFEKMIALYPSITVTNATKGGLLLSERNCRRHGFVYGKCSKTWYKQKRSPIDQSDF